jgi:hypothetical protein
MSTALHGYTEPDRRRRRGESMVHGRPRLGAHRLGRRRPSAKSHPAARLHRFRRTSLSSCARRFPSIRLPWISARHRAAICLHLGSHRLGRGRQVPNLSRMQGSLAINELELLFLLSTAYLPVIPSSGSLPLWCFGCWW